MIKVVIAFLVGLFVGGAVSIVAASLCYISKMSEEREQ